MRQGIERWYLSCTLIKHSPVETDTSVTAPGQILLLAVNSYKKKTMDIDIKFSMRQTKNLNLQKQ